MTLLIPMAAPTRRHEACLAKAPTPILQTLALLIGLLTFAPGCAVFGVAATVIDEMQPPAYVGLANQSVGVLVWADRSILLDYPRLPLDIAGGVQAALAPIDNKDFKGSTWPTFPDTIFDAYRKIPHLHASPITDIAPHLGVTRLIYVEIDDFSTVHDVGTPLLRGLAKGSLKVIEIDGDFARIAYEESGITASFPRRTLAGEPRGNPRNIYSNTVRTFGEEIAKRFVEHPKPREPG
jgi:hypothetical protein